ncbi:MAG: TRAP transporter large permease, partial [Halomonas venusta]|nr:TRAP transporter large permease [Halomonas venusta]
MTTIMVVTMIALLLLGFPMMIPLITAAVIGFYMMFNGFGQMDTLIQQMMAGIRPASLIAVPMFILAADIMTRGQSANRLIDMVMSFIGHIKGGLAVSTAASCTLFGAVSGSTQATVVAVGSPLRPKMLKAGYSDPFTLALIINASDIAFLIPPSIGMIIYGVISGTSIGELFIAGIGPGLLILFMFSVYCIVYAVVKGVPTEPRASWKERAVAVQKALWPLGFPVIIVGGIYGGIFSPTEAAAACVLYAVLLEFVVFRSLKMNDIYAIAKSTGLITAVVFILVAVGNGFSWIISFAQIPQMILEAVGVNEAGPTGVLIAICISFFVACMFVDPIVVILVLTPIFAPAIAATGLDP